MCLGIIYIRRVEAQRSKLQKNVSSPFKNSYHSSSHIRYLWTLWSGMRHTKELLIHMSACSQWTKLAVCSSLSHIQLTLSLCGIKCLGSEHQVYALLIRRFRICAVHTEHSHLVKTPPSCYTALLGCWLTQTGNMLVFSLFFLSVTVLSAVGFIE